MWKKSLKSLVVTVALTSVAVGMCSPKAEAQLNFQDGDRVSIIGNSLASRLQYSGWLETLIQSRSEGKHLTFRNLGFPGDQVAKRPRNKGYMTPEEYLTHCESDVIFAMFGYNESFAGKEGLDSFRQSLREMIDAYRELKPNGKSAPRMVLFSPIA
ncbi:MAG: hypothetical protein HOH33_14175, partial [Verrucomicrobia bacterium]|nr:hypothetical protein [Verrucomicrobiota bacterium]